MTDGMIDYGEGFPIAELPRETWDAIAARRPRAVVVRLDDGGAYVTLFDRETDEELIEMHLAPESVADLNDWLDAIAGDDG